jgi:hypothetical protein
MVTPASGLFLMALDNPLMNVSIATMAKRDGHHAHRHPTAVTLDPLVMASPIITSGKVSSGVFERGSIAADIIRYRGGGAHG